jgi:hypothetical protein
MSHVRTQIVSAAVVKLTGMTTTGSNVFAGRVYPIDVEELPCLCVRIDSETIETDADMNTQHRIILLVVDGHARAGEAVDEVLDDIAAEVETAMFTDQFLGGLTQGMDLISTEKEFSDNAEKETGTIHLTFQAHCLTRPGVPGTAI